MPSPQPFFEPALGGPNSSFCSGSASCTAAVVKNFDSQIASTQVYDLWAGLNQGILLGARADHAQQPLSGGCRRQRWPAFRRLL